MGETMLRRRLLLTIMASAMAASTGLPATAHSVPAAEFVAIYWDGASLLEQTQVVPLTAVEDLEQRLEAVPGVLAAGVEARRFAIGDVPAAVQGDPRRDEQWGLSRLDAEKVRERGDGTGLVVAVVDTGVDATHPDLAGKVLPGFDAVTKDSDGRRDPHGHGTHVAGIIAATPRNGIGGAGLAPGVQILPVRVLDETGYGDDSDVARGVLWAVQHGADVINLSLGGPDRDPLLADAIDVAVDAGVAVIVAAGNDGMSGSPVSYPGAHPRVVAVAASTAADTRAAFSTVGSYVDVAAPGMAVLSTFPGSSMQYLSGTSMAAPFVTAAVADVVSATGRKPLDAMQLLVATATDIDAVGTDSATGTGLIDPYAAVTDAKRRTIDQRPKVTQPSPELPAQPPLELPPLPPMPPLPDFTVPDFSVPAYPLPKFDLPGLPGGGLLPPGFPTDPTQPQPTQPPAPPSETPAPAPTPPSPPRGTKRTTASLTVSVVRVGGGFVVKARMRAGSSPVVGRSLTVVCAGKSYSLRTDALGRARVRVAASRGKVRFRGDSSYSPVTVSWRA